MLGGSDIYKVETDFEQAMRVKLVRPHTKKQLDEIMYREAARRVWSLFQYKLVFLL